MAKYSVAIDGNEANVLQKVGSNAYAFEILVSLEELTAKRKDIEITVLLSDLPNDQMPSERAGWKYVVFGPRAFWTQIALPIHLFIHKPKYDVFYTPGHYAPRVSVIPYVSSVMDLAFLYFPKQFRKKDYLQLKEWTRYSVRHAKKVIAISEFTQKDVLKTYRIPKQKVVIAYPGIRPIDHSDFKEKERLEVFKKWNINYPYVLYVGTLQPRKNVHRLIEAFELLCKELKDEKKKSKKKHSLGSYKVDDLKLVIVGKIGWLADGILRQVESSSVKNQIILTGYVSEKEKNILYRESLCTVLVGLYEGFGIPALEAMAHGTIPIVSETTSLPEVVGEAGIKVNPKETGEIAEAIRRVLEMPAKEHAYLLKKGRQQIKKFTWEKSAEIILQTLLELIKK